MGVFNLAWVDDVCSKCDPIFDAADVGFKRQVQYNDLERQLVSALLWEADPERFAARYPDSGIVEAYGEQWRSVDCIDYWAYVDHETKRAQVSVEGWDFPDVTLDLGGCALDGFRLAHLFARILGVSSPRV